MTVDLSSIREAPRNVEEVYGRLLRLSHFGGQRSTQGKFEAAIEALQHEIALSTTPRGRSRRYVGFELLPGERIVLDSKVTIPRMMGGLFVGPGKRISQSTGHDGYAQDGHIQASSSFSDDAMLQLVDCAGTVFRGLNFRGHSASAMPDLGIGTESNSGAGTSNLLFDDCSFAYLTRAMSMGEFTGSPILDSDCTWRRCDFLACSAGVEFKHNQSLVQMFDRCAWNSVGVGLLVTNGGYIQVRMGHTYDVSCLMRVVQIASNGGEVLIDGLRMDGTTYRTQILDLLDSHLAHGLYTIRGAKRIVGTPTSTTPAVQARSRSHVLMERCDLGEPGTVLDNKWVAIGAGSDNTDPGIVTLRSCQLGTATAANVAGTVAEDLGVVQFRECFYQPGTDGYSLVTDTVHAPQSGG